MDGPISHLTATYETLGSTQNGLALVRVYGNVNRQVDTTTTTADSNGIIQEWIDQAVTMLQRQWPRDDAASGGESYREKLVHSYQGNHGNYELPCSYLLLQDNKTCVGHGRLTECFESAGGNAAAATFIIVDDSLRGKGLGRQLMEFLEEEAKRLGYHYLYLWTKTAIPFYQKIGYRECQRVSLKRACLKVLQESQVETLEAVLFRKTQQQHYNHNHQQPQGRPKKQRETVLLPPTKEGEDDTAPDVWLRKRLVEHVGSRQVPLSERLDEMKEIIAGHVGETRHWRYFLLSLPWQAQVGPSCGLAALRMIHEYYLFDRSSNSNASNHDAIDEQIQRPSLLGEAQERGYTQDGEVFNANHLLSLARDACGLKGEMCSPQTLQPQQIGQTLWDGGVFVLPYDSNPRTRLPALLSGKNAHYGIIVGILAGWKLDTIGSTGMDEPVLDSLDDVAALAHCDKELFYVLVQHSLSPKLSVAPLSAFVSSNQQLDTADDNKFEVQELDLKDRIILLRGI